LPVLEFWFGPEPGRPRAEWFRKDPAFDAEVGRRFGAMHAQAAAGGMEDWCDTVRGNLALVIVLDQFSRNLFRDDARAFAQDARARSCARAALARGDDLELSPVERQFLYLPFEHSEVAADQDIGVAKMRELEAFEETRGLTQWAEKHRAIIQRFGRFPHRNRALGRASTPEETAFLETPGSGF
jgi:uncharacterized protein (DUF924 family)